VRVSANGWPIESSVGPSHDVQELRLVGTPAHVRLRLPDVATILVHVVRRLHYEVAALDAGQVVGFRPASVLRTRHESNHASGTAVDVRREWYPAGTRGGFSATETVVIRDILAECEGIVRWGGDYRYSPDESHFQIDVLPTDPRLPKLARRLRVAAGEPDGGPGAEAQLPFIPRRRTEARRLALRQAGAV
jgi:D-alanyl-D-alanine carboxypeptidase-like protein